MRTEGDKILDGVLDARDLFCAQSRFKSIQLVSMTPPRRLSQAVVVRKTVAAPGNHPNDLHNAYDYL
jgi:hypothetical protein